MTSSGNSATGTCPCHTSRWSRPGWPVYGRLCGWTLARAHARAGDRIATATYLGRKDTFDRAIADFAYADQNEKGHDAFAAAIMSGRLVAETGSSECCRQPAAVLHRGDRNRGAAKTSFRGAGYPGAGRSLLCG
jgi:hypothetical protein